MTTSNEQVAKLPLMKRIVMAVRGGVGGGVSAVLILLLVIFVAGVAVAGFLGGLAAATKRNQLHEQSLIKQTALAKQAQTKLQAQKEAIEHELGAQKERTEMQAKDITLLKEQLDHARIEREATEKAMAQFRESLQGNAGTAPKAEPPAKGATLKFGNKQCQMQAGVVKSKDDVNCLNLRGAIDAMNGGPGGYNKPATKPAETKPPEHKP